MPLIAASVRLGVTTYVDPSNVSTSIPGLTLDNPPASVSSSPFEWYPGTVAGNRVEVSFTDPAKDLGPNDIASIKNIVVVQLPATGQKVNVAYYPGEDLQQILNAMNAVLVYNSTNTTVQTLQQENAQSQPYQSPNLSQYDTCKKNDDPTEILRHYTSKASYQQIKRFAWLINTSDVGFTAPIGQGIFFTSTEPFRGGYNRRFIGAMLGIDLDRTACYIDVDKKLLAETGQGTWTQRPGFVISTRPEHIFMYRLSPQSGSINVLSALAGFGSTSDLDSSNTGDLITKCD